MISYDFPASYMRGILIMCLTWNPTFMTRLTHIRMPGWSLLTFNLFLAYDEQGDVVGRIVGIINHRANENGIP